MKYLSRSPMAQFGLLRRGSGTGKNAKSIPVARNMTRRVDLTLEPKIMESPFNRNMLAPTYEFSVTSNLAASAAKVWKHAASMKGVNRQLFPIARMTYPKSISRLDRASIAPGRRLFRS
jgi:hypothetical protein